MSVDLVAITQALREAADQIRALPDGELVAMALRAQQASEAGRSPAREGAGSDAAPVQGSLRGTSRRAEAPKSPALSDDDQDEEEAAENASARPTGASRVQLAVRVEQALAVLSRSPMTRKELLKKLGRATAGAYVNKLFAVLRNHPRVKAPDGRGGKWSLK